MRGIYPAGRKKTEFYPETFLIARGGLFTEAPCSRLQGSFAPQGTNVILIAREPCSKLRGMRSLLDSRARGASSPFDGIDQLGDTSTLADPSLVDSLVKGKL